MLHRFYCAHIPLLSFWLCIFLSHSFFMMFERGVRNVFSLYTRYSSYSFVVVVFFFFKFHYEIFIAATLLLSLFSSTIFGVIFLCWFIWFILPTISLSIHSHEIANQNFYANRRSVKFLIYSFSSFFFSFAFHLWNFRWFDDGNLHFLFL